MSLATPSFGPAAWKAFRASGAFTIAEPPSARLRRRPRPARTAAVATAAGIAAGMAAALGWLALPGTPPQTAMAPSPPRPAPAPAPAWSEVAHPFEAYDLAGGPYARLPLRYAARRDHAGGAREDTLTYGAPQPGTAFLRVAFLRRGGEPVPEASVFLDAARLAGGAGLAVTRSGLWSRIDTRFGPFEVTGVVVEAAGRSGDCLSFRLADPAAAPVLALTGLACGTVEPPIDPVTLGCTIDRLDLVSAGDDEALRAVFVAAEQRRRDGCAAHAPVWVRLDDGSGGSPGPHPFKTAP